MSVELAFPFASLINNGHRPIQNLKQVCVGDYEELLIPLCTHQYIKIIVIRISIIVTSCSFPWLTCLRYILANQL
ncbi:hypothetical protein Lalb_Chr16g0379591 [Lupinus albus]|uniref:Uncharacterized protein n=1 Tax=Lupinus albus TaxID=3870 RepID=A0A6A4P533_LUPAL|nr:hypothetical protein Lalb_Chr16g0379591 [Lupinus albus]